MNTFRGLKPEEGENTDIPEITNEKMKKKYVKKVRQKNARLKKCDCEKTKEKLSEEIRIIQIEIDEYENKGEGIPTKKPKHESKVKEKFVFDKEEIRNFNEKRQRENEEEAKDKEEARKEREEKSREYWDKWERRSEYWKREENERREKQRENNKRKWKEDNKQDDDKEEYEKESFNLNSFIKGCNMDLKDVPKDIINLYHNFSLEDYKKLSRNYHPDKLSGKQEYMYILNGIKDYHKPNNQGNDETWMK